MENGCRHWIGTFYVLFVDDITRNITKDKDLKDYEIPDKG